MTEKPRKQTRQAVSVSQELYDRIKAHGKATNRSMSSIVEESIEAFLPQNSDEATHMAIHKAIQKRQRATKKGN